MANVIRIKRRASGSASGVALPALRNAELAFNEVNNTLYIGRGGDTTGATADATATVVAGDGVVWTGTQTFGTVNAGGGVYAYKDTYPVDPKLLATVDYVDDAISRGSGATLYPHAANADCATTAPLLTAAPYDKLQSFPDVRVAWTPTTVSSYSETYPLSGLKQLQGVSLAAGDRVLLLNHLQPGFKGIWVVSTGQWTRATEANYVAFYTTGKRVKVSEGTNANKIYEVAAPGDHPTNDNPRTQSQLAWNVTTSQPVTSAAALYQRVVRAAASVYAIENNKIKVDGVVLNDGDRFLWMPEYTGSGGAPISDIFTDIAEPQPTGGIYRVDYSNVTPTGTPFAAAVRDRDLMLPSQFEAANNTKVLVREGLTNKQKIYTINAATPFTVGTTVPTFTYHSTYSESAPGFRGTPIIDGYTTQVENLGSNQIGSTILVKDEVDETYNGLYYIPALSGSYTANNVPWVRHSTADAAGELIYGSYIRVLNGAVNRNLAFVQVGEGGEDKIITPSNEVPAGSGTTSAANNNPDLIVFRPATASSDIIAGIGLVKANRTLYVKTASSSRITVSEAGVDLATVPGAGTDGLSASTAYILTHVDAYGRVTENSSTTITAADFRNKLFSVSANDTATGTGNVVFSDSPALTGTPTAPSPAANDDSTQIATTAWVTDALATGGGAQLLSANNTWTGNNIFRTTAGTRFEQVSGQAAVIVTGGVAASGNFTTTISPTNSSPTTGSGAVAALTANRTITLPDASTTLVGFDTTQTLSNKTLSAPKIPTDGGATVRLLADANGNEIILFPSTVTSAVNEITVTNAATGNRPGISATGNDTNIDLRLAGKGTGTVFVDGSLKLATGSVTSIADVNGNEIVRFPTTVTSAVNEITVTNAATGNAPDISATGGDTNINLKLTAKGSGVVNSASDFTVASGKALNVSTATGLTAAGTNQGTALALTNDINVVTTAAAGTGVALPTGTAGRRVVVINRGANALNVYPASGGTIDALATNAAIIVPASTHMEFSAATTTQWYSEATGVTAATYGSATQVAAVTVNAAGRITSASSTNIQTASTSQAGLVQLENSTSSTSTSTAATPSSVKSAYDLANAALPKSGGTMTGAITFAAGQTWPTFNQSTTGNAATATKLATAVNINGVSFDGSANITVADSTKLPLAGGTMTGAIAFAAGQTWPTFNQSTTGNAATATKLATAVNINGVSFDGSANITVADSTKLPLAGGTMTGKLTTVTSTTSIAAVNVPSGVAPATPSSGDFWNEGGALKFNNGATKTIAYTDSTITGNAGGLSNTLVVGSGGTGATTFTSNGIIYGNGTSALQVTAAGTNNQVLQGNTSGAPSWVSSTGSGNVVRATSPQLTTSVTTDSTTFALLNTTATTVNAFGAATTLNIGASTGTTTINNDVTVGGNLTVTGTTTTLNTSTLQVADKNIELAKVTAKTGLTASLGLGTNFVTLTTGTTSGLIPGQALSKTSGVGAFGTSPVILAIIDSTTFTVGTFTSSMAALNHATAGAITFDVLATESSSTAVGAGITVRDGGTGRNLSVTFYPAAMWLSSEHFGIASDKSYYIGLSPVISSTAVGNGNTDWSGKTVTVDKGGTGATTFTSNGVIYGNSTSALQVTTAGSQYQVLRAGSGGTPAFGAINLDQSAAVTGTLPVGNGGTGATTLTGLVKGNGASAFSAATAGTDYLAPPSGTALLKANSGGALANATAGTDYVVGGTTTVGKIVTQAAVAGAASLLITPQSATPTTLSAGDIWNDAGTIKFRQTAATKDIAFTDSNITGTAAGLSATLVATSGGTGQSTYAIGDLLYASASNALSKLAGNTTTTRRVLTQTGTGSASAAPSWVNQCDIVADCTIDGGTF